VSRQNYRGSNAKRLEKVRAANAAAQKMEQVINELLLKQTEPIRSYLWMEISQASRIPYDTVQDVGYGIDGGSNGFTAIRYDLTYEKAMAMLQKGTS
jgi:hypothetical protein